MLTRWVLAICSYLPFKLAVTVVYVHVPYLYAFKLYTIARGSQGLKDGDIYSYHVP